MLDIMYVLDDLMASIFSRIHTPAAPESKDRSVRHATFLFLNKLNSFSKATLLVWFVKVCVYVCAQVVVWCKKNKNLNKKLLIMR